MARIERVPPNHSKSSNGATQHITAPKVPPVDQLRTMDGTKFYGWHEIRPTQIGSRADMGQTRMNEVI